MEGKLVRLRAYEKSDLDAVMKWVNDEEVTELLGDEMFAYPVSRAQEEKFIEHAVDAVANHARVRDRDARRPHLYRRHRSRDRLDPAQRGGRES